ncbi:MAG TPA: hypothetical protein VMY78_09855 [Solirubrobacteraceae bacterium]|nr:hypothetical protein [Solirubrobacteraceae bacterium]
MTIGLSPKAVLAFAFPLIAAIVTSATSALATGNFDTREIIVAATGLGTSGLALLGAYIGQPGNVHATIDGPGSDELMPRHTRDALERADPPPPDAR